MYAKIFDSMYEGTLYGHWQAIVTLQQMLVLCDSAGVIDMTPQAISARTSIPLDIITKGIEVLSAPDPYSRTPGEDGRRIATIDGHRPWGWYIVNHAKYQKLKSREEKLEADRVRMAEKRNTNKNKDVADSRKQSQVVAEVAHADADADTNKKQKQVAFAPPDWVPLDAWNGFCEMRKKSKGAFTERAKALLVAELFRLVEAGGNAAAILDQSTKNGWKDIYAVKQSGNGKAQGLPWWSSNEGIQAKATELHVEPRKGESWNDLKARVSAAMEAHA